MEARDLPVAELLDRNPHGVKTITRRMHGNSGNVTVKWRWDAGLTGGAEFTQEAVFTMR